MNHRIPSRSATAAQYLAAFQRIKRDLDRLLEQLAQRIQIVAVREAKSESNKAELARLMEANRAARDADSLAALPARFARLVKAVCFACSTSPSEVLAGQSNRLAHVTMCREAIVWISTRLNPPIFPSRRGLARAMGWTHPSSVSYSLQAATERRAAYEQFRHLTDTILAEISAS